MDGMNRAGPRVFQEGTVTIVVGPDGVRTYVGTSEVRSVSHVVVDAGEDGRKVGITVDSSEEDLRLIRSVPWIQPSVRRGPSFF